MWFSLERWRFGLEPKLPIDMREGALIDYRIALSGIPFGWRTRIEPFEPEV